MAAPSIWSVPTSGDSLSPTTTSSIPVSYCGTYWFAASQGASNLAPRIRYATDPSGAWSEATLPAAPSGYTANYNIDRSSGVVTDGTTYALLVRYGNGSTFKYRLVYATDPSGTWSSHEYDTADRYSGVSLAYGDGTWVLVGRDLTPSPRPAFIGTCSTVNGTWSFDTTTAGTGYDTTGMTGTQYWEIRAIAHDGTTWVSTAYQSSTGGTYARHSTSLSSGWAAPSSITLSGTTYRIRVHANGWWSMIDASANAIVTSTPSGTWTTLTSSTTLLDETLGGIDWTGGYWVAAGEYFNGVSVVPFMTYLKSDGSPASTFSPVATTNMTDSIAFVDSVAAGEGTFVAANLYAGELRYAYASVATGPTYLRQRQSPKRTPSRVSYRVA
jgi:hypothetical protein